LIGVSGGRDSMALLHGLLACGFHRLIPCHLNHQLRQSEADLDENFVRSQASKLNLPFHSEKIDIPTLAKKNKTSIETTARLQRLLFFAHCAQKFQTNTLFLAHHAQDQVETLLLHLLRGTGPKGLAAMEQKVIFNIDQNVNLSILRPMLDIPPDSIQSWMLLNQIPWRNDSSNSSTLFLRNRIRLNLLPLLNQIAGRNCLPPLLRTANILHHENQFLNSLLQNSDLNLSLPHLPTKKLAQLPLPLRRRAILTWLRNQGLHDAGFHEVQQILRLIPSPDNPLPASKVNLPHNIHARRTRQTLYLQFPQKN
ncbi:MAG: tRNA lysidine(34) synthetase TilS, partial [Chthoniobacterales bacterium]|nr:tRNA lysidine(34) synthetase TilS [Chthoniobacterales bacterium]